MKSYFLELFDYNHQMNLNFSEVIIQSGGAVPEPCIKLFSHVLNAHHIWNSRILDEDARLAVWEISLPDAWENINLDNYKTTRELMDLFELDRVIAYQNSKGVSFEGNLRDIHFHVLNHSNYHRAQIASALKANNITPPISDYIFYKR